jgi:hypothetical protein
MHSMRRSIVHKIALILLALTGWSVSASTQQSNNAVLILDNSSSMSGQITGTPKITIARDMLGSLFDEFENRVNLGILAYGTKSNSCDDIETLKPIGNLDTQEYTKTIGATKQKGTSPIAASLNAASKLFTDTKKAQSIILVTDGRDDCKGDPCAAARSLKQKSPNTIIHVVTLGEKVTELACVAEETGGMFATAMNEGEFEVAIRRAFELAVSGDSSKGGTAGGGQIAGGIGTPGGAPATSNDPGMLNLAAILAPGSPQLSSGITWRLYDGRSQDDGSYQLVKTSREAKPSLALAPGDYLINASYGRAQITKRVTVWPGKELTDTFNLNAGGVRLYATLAKQPLVSEHTLIFDVFSEETDQSGNRRKIIGNAKPGVVIRLNSGTYRVQSAYGDSNALAEVDVTVEPGKITETTVDHQAGKITFKLVQRKGGEALADTTWNIFTGNGVFVKKSGGAFPTHVLAAGVYKVNVEHGGHEYEASFSVAAGDKKVVEIVMP